MSIIDLNSYRITIEIDSKGKSKLTVDPPNRINLETIANVLSVNLRMIEREIILNTMLQLIAKSQATQMQLNHLPSLDEIKKSKQ
jgi:hypothetical protein